MTVWLLAINKQCCSYEELKYRKVIAQGWSAIGDLSPLLPLKDEKIFKEIVNSYVSYVYGVSKDKRDPGRIMLNLLSMKKDDYVICCEGEKIRGIAQLTKKVKYSYQNPFLYDDPNSPLYEYAQTICPVTNWKDIINSDHGIKLSSMGPVGIQRYQDHDEIFISKLYDNL